MLLCMVTQLITGAMQVSLMARQLTDAGDSSAHELSSLQSQLEDAARQLQKSATRASELEAQLASAQAEVDAMLKVGPGCTLAIHRA
jgi:peptidoglycan hydrolase CwlO-like protein